MGLGVFGIPPAWSHLEGNTAHGQSQAMSHFPIRAAADQETSHCLLPAVCSVSFLAGSGSWDSEHTKAHSYMYPTR